MNKEGLKDSFDIMSHTQEEANPLKEENNVIKLGKDLQEFFVHLALIEVLFGNSSQEIDSKINGDRPNVFSVKHLRK